MDKYYTISKNQLQQKDVHGPPIISRELVLLYVVILRFANLPRFASRGGFPLRLLEAMDWSNPRLATKLLVKFGNLGQWPKALGLLCQLGLIGLGKHVFAWGILSCVMDGGHPYQSCVV